MTTKKDLLEAKTNLINSFKLQPGETIYLNMKHVSRSGMYRVFDMFVMRDNQPLRISWSAATLLEGYDQKHEGCKASGCGMDMGFHLVYNLGTVLFPDGFDCVGQGCPSNHHSNSREEEKHHSSGGYAFKYQYL